MKKIQCGGFYVDDEAIETREGKPFLKISGGGDMVVNVTYDEDNDTYSADKSLADILAKAPNVKLVYDGTIYPITVFDDGIAIFELLQLIVEVGTVEGLLNRDFIITEDGIEYEESEKLF